MRFANLAILGFVAATLIAESTHAASVRQTSVDEMLARCAFVFEGEAVATGSEESKDGRHIFSWVDFAVLDVIKGPGVGTTLRLYFLGGAVGDLRVEVAGMRVPAVGERGIYFVENLSRRQVHPLFGWDQGLLRIEASADGVSRVLSADGRPVTGIRPAAPRGGNGSGVTTRALSRGVATEIEVDPAAALTDAMSAEAVKSTLRRRLAGAAQ